VFWDDRSATEALSLKNRPPQGSSKQGYQIQKMHYSSTNLPYDLQVLYRPALDTARPVGRCRTLAQKEESDREGKMDPRKLIYLASVIEHGSFKKAAKQLLISQPALSTSMDRFEQSVGCQLLERGPAGVTPTPLGELLYAHARLIRDELDLAERRMEVRDAHNESTLAFGTLPSLATSIVPTAVCRWREMHAAKTLRIVEKIQLELLLSLIRGELEFIVAQTECYGFLEGLKQRVLFRDRLHIIGSPNHPAFRLKRVSWSDLAQFPWVLQMVGRQMTLLEKLLTADGVDLPKQLTECGSVGCIKSLVAESDNLAMLPASAIGSDVREGRIRTFDIVDPLLNRDIAVMFQDRCPLSPASRDLVARIEASGLDLGHDQLAPGADMAMA
jgi:DNA-binding transcriptional LysR family regulator